MFSDEEAVSLANPLADNMAVMRTSLIPGLMSALQFNANRQHERIRFFEVGASYHKNGDQFNEVQRLAGVVMGPVVAPQWGANSRQNIDFYDIKADLEAVLALTGHTNPIIFDEVEQIALHPGQSASITRRDHNGQDILLGWVGRLHPSLEKHYGVENVYVFELNLDLTQTAELPTFKGVSRFPSTRRDLSVVVDNELAVVKLLDSVRSKLGQSLNTVEVLSLIHI